MKIYVLDLETRCSVDLRAHGAYRYVESPDLEILVGVLLPLDAADSVPPLVWRGTALPPLPDQFRLVGHNIRNFDMLVWRKFGFPEPAEIEDTIDIASAAQWPTSLDGLGAYLGNEKDKTGKLLISRFCIPRKGRFLPMTPQARRKMTEYCVQDTRVTRQAYQTMPPIQPCERDVYEAHLDVVRRGIRIDTALADCVARSEDRRAAELVEASEQEITTLRSWQQVKAIFADAEYDIPDTRRATMERVLDDDAAPWHLRRIAEAKVGLGRVAGKKAAKMVQRVDSCNRLRGHLRYYGAHTGRWSGRGCGVNLQNLPRPAKGVDEAVAVRDALAGRVLSSEQAAACLRPCLLPDRGDVLYAVDYSSIEARILAWLAGEDWLLDAFRDGRDVYVDMAERLGVPAMRQVGKVAVLSCGYGAGKVRFGGMAAGFGVDLSALGLAAGDVVDGYRESVPNIAGRDGVWKRFHRAMRRGGRVGPVEVERYGNSMRIVLPSGRVLTYPTIYEVDAGEWPDGGRKVDVLWTAPNKRVGRLYGGSITENVTQAIARDVLADALVRAVKAGLRTILLVHDEIVGTGKEDDYGVLTQIMLDPPGWAKGMPIAVEGYVADRYYKNPPTED